MLFGVGERADESETGRIGFESAEAAILSGVWSVCTRHNDCAPIARERKLEVPGDRYDAIDLLPVLGPIVAPAVDRRPRLVVGRRNRRITLVTPDVIAAQRKG